MLFVDVAVFDGTGREAFPGEVLVHGNRIEAVASAGSRIDRGRAEVVIEGGGNTLMPGLVEPHSHLTFASAIGRISKEWLPPPERHQFIATHNAKTLLDHGFTSAFSAGATRPTIEVALRDEIAGGWLPGPRIKASSFERTVSGTRVETGTDLEAARTFANEMIALGVDSMKLILSGRGAMEKEHWQQINYGDDELSVVSQLARDAGVFLTCHAYTSESVKLALRNGFHALYHCNFVDEETIDLIEGRKDEVFVAPAVGILMADAYERFPTREQAEAIGAFEALEGQRKAIPEMHRRGIRVLPGGDYGFPWNPIGRNARDLELFVTEFGFKPAEALRAATQYGGEMMGMGTELGLVREGYLADLLIVKGDPVQDIKLMQDASNLMMIMKDGHFYKRPLETRSEDVTSNALN